MAQRLVAEDGHISCQEVWRLPQTKFRLERCAWRDGKVYSGGSVLDGATGKVVSATRASVDPGYCGGGGILAGGYYLCWNFYGRKSKVESEPVNAEFIWMDIATGKKAGQGVLPVNPSDGLPVTLRREQAVRSKRWMWLGAATPFAWRDRLYIRANEFVWCLGSK